MFPWGQINNITGSENSLVPIMGQAITLSDDTQVQLFIYAPLDLYVSFLQYSSIKNANYTI